MDYAKIVKLLSTQIVFDSKKLQQINPIIENPKEIQSKLSHNS